MAALSNQGIFDEMKRLGDNGQPSSGAQKAGSKENKNAKQSRKRKRRRMRQEMADMPKMDY